MNDTLRYEKIDLSFKDLDAVEEIYNTAFPPEERFFTIRQALELGDELGTVERIAVYDEDVMVGFYVLTNHDGYKYLTFLAVNQKIRNKGYGGRILERILEENKDTIVFGSVEKPVPGEDTYDIRLRRQYFYERHGMITVDMQTALNGVEYLSVTNRTGEEYDRCYKDYMKQLDKQLSMRDA